MVPISPPPRLLTVDPMTVAQNIGFSLKLATSGARRTTVAPTIGREGARLGATFVAG